MGKAKCSVCGSEKVLAKINGKYYCFKCGSKIIDQHIREQIIKMKEEGLIPPEFEL
ncbi:MAG: hypothetical protein DRJ44_03800 [Thermoprotei archaeon]|nr:TFIIB-type zinc finger domain-containing protein [Thermoproteales archaeon]RLE76578.1 MAG: hypothetical protein DRJ44_03800 [Thermoprotei archaeon]